MDAFSRLVSHPDSLMGQAAAAGKAIADVLDRKPQLGVALPPGPPPRHEKHIPGELRRLRDAVKPGTVCRDTLMTSLAHDRST